MKLRSSASVSPLLLLLLAYGAAALPAPTQPDGSVWTPGNHTVRSFKLAHSLPDGLHMEVWTPEEAGLYPTIGFASAFGMNTPSSMYSKVFTRIASHGIIVAAVSKLNNPNYTILATDFAAGAEWMHQHLADAITHHAMWPRHCPAQPDMEHAFVVAAHSAGNHVVAQMLQNACDVSTKAFVMIDPVDGVDPFGEIKEYVIHPPAKVNFSIPALHIETGNDPVPVFKEKWYPACAPANMSNSRFYDAWRGPIWQVNATKYGHLDVTDPGIERDIGGMICKEEKGIDLDSYRNTVGDLVAVFLRAVLHGDAGSISVLENAEEMPIDVILQHKNIPPVLHAGCTNP